MWSGQFPRVCEISCLWPTPLFSSQQLDSFSISAVEHCFILHVMLNLNRIFFLVWLGKKMWTITKIKTKKETLKKRLEWFSTEKIEREYGRLFQTISKCTVHDIQCSSISIFTLIQNLALSQMMILSLSSSSSLSLSSSYFFPPSFSFS